MPISLDLNLQEFQTKWFALEKEAQRAVLSCCVKISRLSWNELYRNNGLKWELIQSRQGPADARFYSIRVTQKIRAIVRRNGDQLQFLSLHADHDSAYE